MALREIQVRRDVVPRPALEDDSFDAVTIVLPASPPPRASAVSAREIAQRCEKDARSSFCLAAICSGVLIAATALRSGVKVHFRLGEQISLQHVGRSRVRARGCLRETGVGGSGDSRPLGRPIHPRPSELDTIVVVAYDHSWTSS